MLWSRSWDWKYCIYLKTGNRKTTLDTIKQGIKPV